MSWPRNSLIAQERSGISCLALWGTGNQEGEAWMGVESRFELVRSESEQLKRYLYSLPPDAWSRPGACHRWEVRDVVAHLAGGAEFYAAMISRGMQGDSSPPNGLPAAGGVNGVSFAETIAQRAISLREQLTDPFALYLRGLGCPADPTDIGARRPGLG